MERKASRKTVRKHWLDNLRSIMILLVVLYHIGGVYEAAGLWSSFWIVDDPATISWVGIVGIMFDVTMLPVIFWISGYLAPASLERKGAQEFVLSKAKRLLIPWAIAVLTLIPIYKVIFLYSRGLPQDLWTTYLHWNHPNSQNWLWFMPLLFFCYLIYVALDKLGVRFSRVSPTAAVVWFVPLAVVASMVVGSLAGFRSWTLTPILDFENERVLAHLMSFVIGAICQKSGVLETKPTGKLWYNIANGVAWLPVTGHIFVRILPFFSPSGFEFTTMYRLWFWLSFHASSLCMAYVLIQSFRRYLDRTGPVWRALNRSSFGVYIVHVILIGVFATLLMGTSLPAIVRYLLVIVATYVGSNLLVMAWGALRRARSQRPLAS